MLSRTEQPQPDRCALVLIRSRRCDTCVEPWASAPQTPTRRSRSLTKLKGTTRGLKPASTANHRPGMRYRKAEDPRLQSGWASIPTSLRGCARWPAWFCMVVLTLRAWSSLISHCYWIGSYWVGWNFLVLPGPAEKHTSERYASRPRNGQSPRRCLYLAHRFGYVGGSRAVDCRYDTD